MTLFRHRPSVHESRLFAERYCLEIAWLLHRGARARDIAPLIQDAAETSKDAHDLELTPNG